MHVLTAVARTYYGLERGWGAGAGRGAARRASAGASGRNLHEAAPAATGVRVQRVASPRSRALTLDTITAAHGGSTDGRDGSTYDDDSTGSTDGTGATSLRTHSASKDGPDTGAVAEPVAGAVQPGASHPLPAPAQPHTASTNETLTRRQPRSPRPAPATAPEAQQVPRRTKTQTLQRQPQQEQTSQQQPQQQHARGRRGLGGAARLRQRLFGGGTSNGSSSKEMDS